MSKKLIPFLLLFFVITSLSAQKKKSTVSFEVSNADKPKLVVGIVVDQMRYDFLYRYSEKYSSGGFKRLMNESLRLCSYGYSRWSCRYFYGFNSCD